MPAACRAIHREMAELLILTTQIIARSEENQQDAPRCEMRAERANGGGWWIGTETGNFVKGAAS